MSCTIPISCFCTDMKLTAYEDVLYRLHNGSCRHWRYPPHILDSIYPECHPDTSGNYLPRQVGPSTIATHRVIFYDGPTFHRWGSPSGVWPPISRRHWASRCNYLDPGRQRTRLPCRSGMRIPFRMHIRRNMGMRHWPHLLSLYLILSGPHIMDLSFRDLSFSDPRQGGLSSHCQQLAVRLRSRHGDAPTPLGH